MLKRKIIYVWISVLMVSVSGFCMDTMNEDKVHTPQKLRIGTTISVFGGLQGLTYENLKEARSAGFSHRLSKWRSSYSKCRIKREIPPGKTQC